MGKFESLAGAIGIGSKTHREEAALRCPAKYFCAPLARALELDIEGNGSFSPNTLGEVVDGCEAFGPEDLCPVVNKLMIADGQRSAT